TRAFVIGDRVKVGETTGDVVERTLLVTRLRTTKNVDVSVPNSMLLSNQIINYSAVAREKGLILHTTVTIGYDVPWRTVHSLLIGAALDTRDILENPKPFVLQTSLDDFYVSYELNAYTHNSKRIAAIYSDMHANIQDKFNEGGVEIMSPHYRAARDGNLTTIPAQYLPEDYRTPRFPVESHPPQE
ncbi:MAG: mechanosensitive ion channel, partial [Bryobacterales bacterium]|nr:mechanosensitive ion channel [Bryobacterales bacterium]